MSNNSYVSSNSMQILQNTLRQISIPYIIFISIIGIVGNVLTIIILLKRSLTKNFNNFTLITLALADLIFNLALVSRCIKDLTGLNSDDNFCRLLSFLSHLAELLSAWFTVHFTIQRFIAVRFPLSVFIEKNIHLLHYLIIPLFILFGMIYCIALVYKSHYDECEEELNINWFISDAVLSFAIPFIIIAILNLLIIFRLRKNSQNNQQLSFTKRTKKCEAYPLHSRSKRSGSSDSNCPSRLLESSITSNRKNSVYQVATNGETKDHFLSVDVTPRRSASIRSTTRSHAQSHRVTRMLILVSTCFLLLNAPAHICTISLKLYTKKLSQLIINSHTPSHVNLNTTSNDTISILNNVNVVSTMSTISKQNQSNINMQFFQSFYVIVIISIHISYLSYSINFFLYSFCGMKFRRELTRFLHKRCGSYQRRRKTAHILIGQNSM